ncbi:WD40 repeat-like protein [Eremomyces bilateralis CBS 781.70]|uniref:WD40 repeat-like protein n=1 Tax=Eremomyces bilateralis CBS 781.70 TaxID=1392243 RepID=A0A6G1FZ42_9PEZI|nr:WD40 repeat-like protein [Eremomyces bilateralis CBS 781.70]KAF1811117.1 WD40 repeat-like protein [Eremomyces bilateralis CBS 781.70]
MSFGAAAAGTSQGDTKGDVELTAPPEDSISDLAFSTEGDYLAVASWDQKVRIYEISQQSGKSEGKAFFQHEGPVLSCSWSKDGKYVVGGGADKVARLIDLGANTSSSTIVAQHDQPIRSVKMFQTNGNNMLVTGSWDKTVKYWDLRQQTPIGSITCQERVYTMDMRNELLVIGTADRYINIVDLNNPMTFQKTLQSPLKFQTRTLACFADASGFAIGSIEGRCAIQYKDDTNSTLNFSFKCHRQNATPDTSKVFAVNAISFHPIHGTFSTAGSDGTFHFWDKDAKHRLKGFSDVGGPITATAFNRTGTIFAYAVSYDWSKGYAYHNPNNPNKIMLHPVVGEECKPRPGGTQRKK